MQKIQIGRAIIKLTDRCQMNCIYCANNDGIAESGRMSLETLEDILTRFSPREVEYTGGEPSICFDFLIQAIERAKRITPFVMVNSNMELLNECKLKQLDSAGLTCVHLAIHTLTPGLHKSIRGNDRADIKKVLANIEYILNDTAMSLMFEFVPMISNLHEFKQVYEYILKKRRVFGDRITKLEVQRLILRGRAVKDLCTNIEDQISVIETIGHPQLPVELQCFGKLSYSMKEKGFMIHQCGAGKENFYFDVQGKVLVDNFSGVVIKDNYKELDLHDVAQQKEPELFVCPLRGES
ncbi:MAG: radical SAM protein [Anaerolineales bacterium]